MIKYTIFCIRQDDKIVAIGQCQEGKTHAYSMAINKHPDGELWSLQVLTLDRKIEVDHYTCEYRYQNGLASYGCPNITITPNPIRLHHIPPPKRVFITKDFRDPKRKRKSKIREINYDTTHGDNNPNGWYDFETKSIYRIERHWDCATSAFIE